MDNRIQEREEYDMSKDIRISISFWEHRKTVKLIRVLGIEAAVSLQKLWMWAASNRPDGDLSGFDTEDLEICAKWDGEPGALVDNLKSLRFIDGEDGSLSLHGWIEHNPWALESKTLSDRGRFNRLKQLNPELAIELEKNGRTELNKEEYEACKAGCIADILSAFNGHNGHPQGHPKTPPARGIPGVSPAPGPGPIPTNELKNTPLTPHDGGEEKSGKEQNPESSCPHQKIIEAYHEILPECPRIRVWPKASERQMAARWRESKERQSLEWWRHVFSDVSQSDFLMGRTARDGPFVFSLGWFVKPTNFAKVLNGQYKNRKQKSSGIRVGGLTF